jgi:hypothetical protein
MSPVCVSTTINESVHTNDYNDDIDMSDIMAVSRDFVVVKRGFVNVHYYYIPISKVGYRHIFGTKHFILALSIIIISYAGTTNLVTLLQGALIGLTSVTEAFIDILKIHDA